MNIDFQRYLETKAKKVPHEMAACVNEIIEEFGDNKEYSYKYWLFVVKKSRMKYGEILSILKEARGLPDKYNRGGFVTNQLWGRTKKLFQ